MPGGLGQWELWFVLGRMGSLWKDVGGRCASSRAASLKSLVLPALHSRYF